MRRIIVALSMVGALLAAGSGVAMANDHHGRDGDRRGDHRPSQVHHPRVNHHPVSFRPWVNQHRPRVFHPRVRHLSWWEQLRLRLFHHR